MKIPILLPIILLASALQAQEKGIIPLSPSTVDRPSSTVRAVVIGISDYQSPQIPDLQFAAADAKMFADWLKSPAGGMVQSENIALLLDEKATSGKVIAAIDGLLEASAAGDLALIYFSGHGDIEKVTNRQNGFLLCHDSPAVGYPSGGTLGLVYLQDYVSTLSEKNCYTVLVTDACHAGKLAGSTVNGPQTTNAALARQIANEVKIMSCQASEFSLEGEQWGGGHGVFSFYLTKGLNGTADKNADGTITLQEMRRYLEDHVSADAAPHQQTPVTMGESGFVLAHTQGPQAAEAPIAAKLQKTDMRGNLFDQDSTTYKAFEKALARGDFFTPATDCAEFYFQKLSQNESLLPLRGLLRRNYAAAITDEIQQAINALLDNDPYEANTWNLHPEKYSQYPAYLARAMELLGENHFLIPSLKSKKVYFEGYNLTKNIGDLEDQPSRRDSFKLAAKAKYLESIRLQPEAAYPYQAIGNLYLSNDPYQTDSVVFYDSHAVDLSPNWLTPYLEIAYEYTSSQVITEQSEKWILKALTHHPKSYLALERLSWLKQWQGKADESIAISKELIGMKPELFNAYSTLAQTLAKMKGEYLESEKYCLSSIERAPIQWSYAQWMLAFDYLQTKREAMAVELGKRCLEYPKSSSIDKSSQLTTLTAALVQSGRYNEALHYFKLADSFEFGDPFRKTWIKLNEGRMYFQKGQLPLAEKTLQSALLLDPTDDPVWIAIWALLGEIKSNQRQSDVAEGLFKKAIAFRKCLFEENLFRGEAFFRYGKFLLSQKRLAEAETQFLEIGKILPKSYFYGYGMALLSAKQGKNAEALDWLEHSLDNFWPDSGAIMEEPLFKKIRKTKRFKALMAKNFPTIKAPK